MKLFQLIRVLKYFFILFVTVLLILLLQSSFKQYYSWIYYPITTIHKVLDLFNHQTRSPLIAKQENFVDQYESLKQELKNYQYKVTILEGENKSLRNLLDLRNLNDHFTYVTVQILAINNSIYNNFAIAKSPSEYNIIPGAWVVNSEGVVGKIASVEAGYLKIMLVTDFNFKIGVKSASSKHRAVLSGKNSDILELSYSKDHLSFSDGDILVTSGDGNYPISNIPVAKITLTQDNNVVATSLVNFNKLDFVSIIVDSNN